MSDLPAPPQPEQSAAAEPLTEDEMRRAAIDSYFDAMRDLGRAVRAGERELPAMFRSTRDRRA